MLLLCSSLRRCRRRSPSACRGLWSSCPLPLPRPLLPEFPFRTRHLPTVSRYPTELNCPLPTHCCCQLTSGCPPPRRRRRRSPTRSNFFVGRHQIACRSEPLLRPPDELAVQRRPRSPASSPRQVAPPVAYRHGG
ncbi:unnamed protein product [Ectocarpus sp. 13 AM-2016]